MKIYQCKSELCSYTCSEDMVDECYCACGVGMEEITRDTPLNEYQLFKFYWFYLADVLCNKDGKIYESFLDFPAGTAFAEIWNWFNWHLDRLRLTTDDLFEMRER